MGTEIERKFLVIGDGWRTGATSKRVRQGYLSVDPLRIVRVRTSGDEAYLTIKGEQHGMARTEFEYAIPFADAEHMLDRLCAKPWIEKTRYLVPHNGLTWEVDEFFGDNAGLIVAEIELADTDQVITLPDWVGQEVTQDDRYYNAQLVQQPYNVWRPAV